MKWVVKFILNLLVPLVLAGCASAGRVRGSSPIAARPLELNLIWVQTSSSGSLGDLEAEKQMLNDRIVSGLKQTGMFPDVSANRTELGSGSGITVNAEVIGIKQVSKNKRLWAGAMIGRAHIRVQVTVSELNSGDAIETFEADGESSGGSALAGTTEEAIDRAAEGVVTEVLKINVQTAR